MKLKSNGYAMHSWMRIANKIFVVVVCFEPGYIRDCLLIKSCAWILFVVIWCSVITTYKRATRTTNEKY